MVNLFRFKDNKFERDIKFTKSNNEQRFKDLIEKDKTKLYRIGRGILKSDFDVDDAMQETILKAWMKINTLRNEKSFTTWITRILINECYTIIRKREKTCCINSYEFSNKDNSLEINNKLDVWTALDKLENEFKLPLILFYFEEFTYEEISTILKIPKGTVKSRIYRGKDKLEGILSNYGRGDKYE